MGVIGRLAVSIDDASAVPSGMADDALLFCFWRLSSPSFHRRF